MKRKLTIPLAALIALVAIQSKAEAVAHHERVDVKEYTEKGEKGIKITLTLLPETYVRARVGIAPAGKSSKDHRVAASDASSGHLIHQFKEIAFTSQDPKKVELKVLYKDAPNIKPGDSFEIVSAYNNDAANKDYWHVYGMTGATGKPDLYTAPGKAPEAAKRRTKVSQIKRSVNRSSNKRRAQNRAAAKKRAPAKKPAAKSKSKRARTR